MKSAGYFRGTKESDYFRQSSGSRNRKQSDPEYGTYGPLFADRVLHKGLDGFGSILFAAGAGSNGERNTLCHIQHTIIHSGS